MASAPITPMYAPPPQRIVAYGPAHPLHVILSAYPIACFTGAFLTDLAYASTYEMQWANFSAWLIAVGLAMGVLAGIAGILEALFTGRSRSRRSGWRHGLGNLLVMALSLWNAFVHSRDAYTSVMPLGITLSAIVAVLVIMTSWWGARQSEVLA